MEYISVAILAQVRSCAQILGVVATGVGTIAWRERRKLPLLALRSLAHWACSARRDASSCWWCWRVPKRAAAPLLYCQRQGGCTGSCPLKVALHKRGQGAPAKCRVCQRVFWIPPGADRWTNLMAPRSKQARRSNQQLQQQVKDLTQQLAAAKDPSSAVSAPEPPSVQKLQAAVDACKLAGISSSDAEAQLAKAKADEVAPTSLRAVLGKLSAAEAHAKQVADQLVKDEEKVQTTRKKCSDAADQIAVLRAEKERLIQLEGTTKPSDPLSLAVVPPPPGITLEQQQNWDNVLAAAQAALKAQLEELVKTFTPPPPEPMDLEAADAEKARKRKGIDGQPIQDPGNGLQPGDGTQPPPPAGDAGDVKADAGAVPPASSEAHNAERDKIMEELLSNARSERVAQSKSSRVSPY